MKQLVFMRKTRALAGAVLLVLCAGYQPALADTGLLDGKVFVGEAGEKGKPADEKNDTITFANGLFHSSTCDQWGYGKAAYKTSGQGDAIAFESETVSPKDGKLAWKGTLSGDKMEGTFTHYRKPSFFRPNPDPVEHWFKATLKN